MRVREITEKMEGKVKGRKIEKRKKIEKRGRYESRQTEGGKKKGERHCRVLKQAGRGKKVRGDTEKKKKKTRR